MVHRSDPPPARLSPEQEVLARIAFLQSVMAHLLALQQVTGRDFRRQLGAMEQKLDLCRRTLSVLLPAGPAAPAAGVSPPITRDQIHEVDLEDLTRRLQ